MKKLCYVFFGSVQGALFSISLDTQKLHTLFCEWMKSVVHEIYGVVAIDGKQARRTKDAKKRPLHVVSAFATECGLVLVQLACDEKSNEIKAIPQYKANRFQYPQK